MTRLIGQQRAETILARAISRSRVAHAYLFLGTPGSGKFTAARLFAQAINCARQPACEPERIEWGKEQERGGENGNGSRLEGAGAASPSPTSPARKDPFRERWRLAPCGICNSCRLIVAGTHPEVLTVRPDSKSRQNITVEQAREIRRNASLRPKMGGSRIYLIPNAEAFNEESANALLKTLEEPSPFVTLILCAPNSSQVLPTIRSRCQIVRFGLAAPEEVERALQEQGLPPARVAALARACGGRPGLALSWALDPGALDLREKVLNLFARGLKAQRATARAPSEAILALRLAEELRRLVSSEREEEEEGLARPAKVRHSENLETGLSYLRDLLLLSHGAGGRRVQNQERISELEELAEHTQGPRVLRDIQFVREAQQLLERNVGAQVVLERMFWGLIAGTQTGGPA